jgi:uncharacterized membrane protein YeiH
MGQTASHDGILSYRVLRVVMFILIHRLLSCRLGVFPVLAIFSALNALLHYRRNIKLHTGNSLEQVVPFGQGVFSLVFGSLGGSVITGILLGQSPSWLNNDGVLLTFILIFTLQYLDSGKQLVLMCERIDLLRWIIEWMDLISLGLSITAFGVDLALASTHLRNSPGAAILCGIISGLGSPFLQDTFHLFDREWSYSTPEMFRRRRQWLDLTFVHIAIYASILYYIGLHLKYMQPDSLRAIIVLGVAICNIRSKLFKSSNSSSPPEMNDEESSKKKIDKIPQGTTNRVPDIKRE